MEEKDFRKKQNSAPDLPTLKKFHCLENYNYFMINDVKIVFFIFSKTLRIEKQLKAFSGDINKVLPLKIVYLQVEFVDATSD